MGRKSVIAVIVVAVTVLLVGAAVVFGYDETQKDKIAKGVTVGGVDVGGQSADQAKATLQRELVAPLNRTIVVRTKKGTFRLTSKEAKTTINLDASVDQALAQSRDGNAASRTWRGIMGGKVEARITPQITYNHDAVSRLVDRVRVNTAVKPQDAKVDFSADAVTVERGHSGKAVNVTTLRTNVKRALADPSQSREITATMRRVKPKVSTAQVAKKYPTIITVDRGAFTLRLWKNLKLEKTYGIAVGRQGLETPAGLYDIENKQINPYWHVPNSDWAGSLAGQVIPPGPQNPIKARWMGIIGGAGIHGTSDDASIGSNASHGCIRMHVPDVEDLYDRVSVGTPVYIA